MKFNSCTVVLCIALLGLASAGSGQIKVNPVQKVVSLLTQLEAKLKADGEAEQKAYAEYSEWCHEGKRDKEFEIKTLNMEIEDLTATIDKADAQITASASQIQELAASITTEESELKAATAVREKENGEFVSAEAELVDVVDTLDRAINVLERNMKSASFVQTKFDPKDIAKLTEVLSKVVDAAGLSLHDKSKLMSLTQSSSHSEESEEDSDLDLGAPAAAVYKGHSEGIIDVLEDLREKAQSELAELRKQEATSRHQYDLLKQSIEDQVTDDKKQMDQAKSTKASSSQTKATASGDLNEATKSLADAKDTLENLGSGCATKEADHETSMASRAEELKAIAGALKALADMSKGAEATTYSFLQVGGYVPVNDKVVDMVKKLAKKTKSTALTQLAGRIANVVKYGASTGEDPFAKVKAMIRDMLDKLIADAGAEAQHKEYCDKEMAGTKEKLEDLGRSQESLSAKIDKAKARVVTLRDEVAELSRQLAETAKAQAEADEARKAERSAFIQTKADLDSGLEGVRGALKILREYYAQSEDASAALFQQPEMPAYHTASDAGSGIIGMLEVIESDFGKSLAEAQMAEDTASTEYEKFSQENRVSTAMKQGDVKYKTKEADGLEKEVTELSSDLSSVQSELDAVFEYKGTIIAQCVAKPESYEERKARREAEIDGLKAALEALEGEAVLMQQGKTGLRGAAISRHQ